jgi:hypothetical protein
MDAARDGGDFLIGMAGSFLAFDNTCIKSNLWRVSNLYMALYQK